MRWTVINTTVLYGAAYVGAPFLSWQWLALMLTLLVMTGAHMALTVRQADP
jgi:hypothetical protein